MIYKMILSPICHKAHFRLQLWRTPVLSSFSGHNQHSRPTLKCIVNSIGTIAFRTFYCAHERDSQVKNISNKNNDHAAQPARTWSASSSAVVRARPLNIGSCTAAANESSGLCASSSSETNLSLRRLDIRWHHRWFS